jgi:hypothetical protein
MYPLHLVGLTRLDESFAAKDERSSDVRLRADDDRSQRPTEPRAKIAKPVEIDRPTSHPASGDALTHPASGDPSECITTRPLRATLQPPPSAAGFDALDEVLFRFSCGDFDGALAAAEALMTRVPFIIMPRSELRAEPLGYWHLLLLARIDNEAKLTDLLVDVPAAEAVRLVCELVERRIIALR